MGREAERRINLKPITAASTQTATSTVWQPNDRVYHKVFGEGTVLQTYNENEVDKIDIQFDKVGKKTLMLTYAKLERIRIEE